MKITSTNPSRNYEVIGEVEMSTPEEVTAAVEAARAAQPGWAALTQAERNAAVQSFIDVCSRRKEDIAQLISKEMGRPITLARSHVDDANNDFRAYIAMAEKTLAPEVVYEDESQLHRQYREPLGVIACIAPWNFPLGNIPQQAGQALLAGNTVLFKPSEEIAVFTELLKELVAASQLPAGVLTILVGDGTVGELMAAQPVDAVSFTGSTKTGQRISEVAAKRSTKIITEMGGSAAGIVFEDADVDRIIDTLYLMRYDNSGQYCDGLKRLLVHRSKLEEVIEALKLKNATVLCGDPSDEATAIGPLVAKRQLVTLQAQVDDAITKGAEVVFGGRQPDDLAGAYYEPTLLTNISFDMRVWKEEVFGPVLPIVPFDTEAEAIMLANDTVYGLGGYIFSEDKERAIRVAKQLKTGNICYNNALYFSPYTPFGGYKASGNSRTCGVAGFHEVTQIKIICEEK